MKKFRIITEEELQQLTEKYFGDCSLVYNYEFGWMHIYIKEPKVTFETFLKWRGECFGEYLTRDLFWHPYDCMSRAELAKKEGFKEWEKGEYYKLERPIKKEDARYKFDDWTDWAQESHKRAVIWLSKDLVEKAIKEYRKKVRDEFMDMD